MDTTAAADPGGAAGDRAGRAVRAGLALTLVLLVLMVGAVAYFLFADHALFEGHPWLAGIAKRAREGGPITSVGYAVRYGTMAAAINALVIAGLLATSRWWLRHGEIVENHELDPPARLPRWLIVLTAGATLALAVLAYPRLSQSLWDDEEYSVYHSIDGAYRRDDSGGIDFREASWWDTLWFYRKPNNHVPYSILSRASLNLWRAVADPELRFVNETVVRLPAYAAGLASVAAMALFLWRIGCPRAGVFAAWFLAIHPWQLRYSSEARGYAFVLLLLPLGLMLLLNALQRGTWRRWCAFGLTQFLLLWTYPAAVYLVGCTNLVAAGALWQLYGNTPAGRVQAARWAVVNVLGAVAWLQIMSPNLAQLWSYLHGPIGMGEMGAGWIGKTLSLLFAGMPWANPGPDAWYPQLSAAAHGSPVVFWGAASLTAALATLGALRLLSSGGIRALLLLVLLAAGPATFLDARLRGARLYPWYVIFTLPCLAALLSLGVTAIPARARWRAAVAMAAYLVGFAWFTSPPRSALRSRSLVPSREAALVTRETLDPFAPENGRVLTAVCSAPWPRYYDPLHHSVERRAELVALMQESEASGRRLFVTVGRMGTAQRRHPELMELVLDEDRFDEVAVLHAFESYQTRHVYRYRPRASSDVAVATAHRAGSRLR